MSASPRILVSSGMGKSLFIKMPAEHAQSLGMSIIIADNQYDIMGINAFMLNRPGRFHCHIRFTYPDANAISAYLHDDLDDKHHDGIEDILNLSSKINPSHDCLQALVFELNMGNTRMMRFDIRTSSTPMGNFPITSVLPCPMVINTRCVHY